jgi:formate dehydrogenase major subunit
MFEGGDVDKSGGDDEQASQAFTDRTAPGLDVHDIPHDETLQHPRCVFQVMRRHYARYTPEMVERVCGVPQDVFLEVADALIANSGRERTTMLAYAVGWTQHTAGVQIIRAGAIVQLLLGNIGRPGGGIMAMRGHASIQGSSDIPTLYEILPGYLPTPRAKEDDLTLEDYIDTSGRKKGWWSHFDAYIISLLKAWFGEAATAENGYGFSHLPKLTGNHSHFPTMLRALDGGLEGLLVMGQNPAVGSIHSGLPAPGSRAPQVARGARSRGSRDRVVLEGLPRDPLGRGQDGGHRHGGVPDARGDARREGRALHEHTTTAPVARQGDRPAG